MLLARLAGALAAWSLVAAVQAGPSGADAGMAPAPSLAVANAWSRATAPGVAVGVAYFQIVNSGPADVLVSIRCTCARRVEMHSTGTVQGMMQMRQVSTVNISAGGRVAFEPNGLHAMLIDLVHPLQEGTRISLTLVFRSAGERSVQAVVGGLGASAADASGGAPSAFRLAVWPPHAASPDLKLVDADGRPRSLADYRGRVVVLFFGFVRCPDACPTELFKLSLAMKQLGAVRERVQVLFVTLDPERDTRKVLKRYVTAFDPHFVGLTGSAAQIDRAARSFFVEYARVGSGADYTIDHSTSTFVLDAHGKLRLVGAMKSSAGDYAHDLAVLAAE